MKVDREYIVLAGSDVVKVKVLDVTATSIRVHNLDDDFIKRYLLEDYKPRVIEEVGEHGDIYDEIEDALSKSKQKERAEILEAVNKPILSEIEHPTKALILGKSNAERLVEILSAKRDEEEEIVEEVAKEDKEIWKEIPNMGQPYLLSNKGRVKSAYGKILKPYKRGDGSLWFQLRRLKAPGCEHLNVDVLLERIFGLKKA